MVSSPEQQAKHKQQNSGKETYVTEICIKMLSENPVWLAF